MKLNFRKLIASLPEGDVIAIRGDAEIDSVSGDTRRLRQGGVFVCLRGLHEDGHERIAEASELASAIVAEREDALTGDCGLPYAIVKNTRRALAYLAAALAGNPQKDLSLIAVTGTNGKTSTVQMLDCIFRGAGYRSAVIGTIAMAEMGGTMTTPDPEELYPMLHRFAEDGITHVFMEASSHALALDKLAPVTFEVGIFTNLTPDHMDFHGSMEAYRAAKEKLFLQCRCGLFNLDDPTGEIFHMNVPCRAYGYSAERDADFYASSVDCRAEGISYMLNGADVTCRIPGSFTVYNTMAAIGAAVLCGVPLERAVGAIASLEGVKGRMERLKLPDGSDIDVIIDYAHTPDALEKLLRSVREFAVGRHITLIFGCGGDRDSSKRRIMGSIATRLADFVIVTADNSRSEPTTEILRGIMKGIDREKPHAVIISRESAIRYALHTSRPGEIILIAGKGHEEYEINATGKHRFSEREIVICAAKERLAFGKTEREQF
ncbi:MAG: UDP-N-acetylmuramoyl-L-alanyl-D-glutamate--2,6-diaminopimelate ligase [Clostridia bacterium]|nr:UDP-N-acetylmuramoyl-L-alanyl-D-glutamate--2,6-diaminopimelate ligase [Clostridia bacterium]